MSKTTRRLLFYSLVLLFIIAGLAVVFYSDGWRVSVKNCSILQSFNCSIRLERTGAVYIQSELRDITIKIGKEIFSDKSGLLQRGTLVGELLPGNYKVEIQKQNYLAFAKNISVDSGLVSEISRVILIPQKIEKIPVALDKPLDNYWFNSGKIVFTNKSNLYFRSENSSVKLRGDKFITSSDDASKIITQDSANQIYYLYNLNNPAQTLNISAALNNIKTIIIKDIKFHPLDSNRLIVQAKNNFLYIFDTNRLTLENIVKEPVLVWTIKNPSIYYMTSSSLTSFNLISKGEDFSLKLPDYLMFAEKSRRSESIGGADSLTSNPPLIPPTAVGGAGSIGDNFTKISASADKIAFLDNSGGLYLLNQQNQNLQKIAHSAQDFVFSPDSQKIAFWDIDGKLNIYFCQDYQDGISKKAGDVIRFDFYLKNGGNDIKNVYWYRDSSHIFVDYIDSDKIEKIDFLELDDRQPINKYILAENISHFNYQINSNQFYFIQNNNLYSGTL